MRRGHLIVVEEGDVVGAGGERGFQRRIARRGDAGLPAMHEPAVSPEHLVVDRPCCRLRVVVDQNEPHLQMRGVEALTEQ